MTLRPGRETLDEPACVRLAARSDARAHGCSCAAELNCSTGQHEPENSD